MKMKRTVLAITALILTGMLSFPVLAAGNVTYSGNSGSYIFAPGSTYSPTDLFPDLKDVMPGGTYTDTVHIENHADSHVQVKIYMRALGAETGSEEFLSKLRLQVKKASGGEGADLFDAPANETATLTDWVYLGTLNTGGSLDLNITLTVPTDLSNEFANRVGYLDWEFKAEEIPLPDAPDTGDKTTPILWISLSAGSLILILFFLIFWKRRDQKENKVSEAKNAENGNGTKE